MLRTRAISAVAVFVPIVALLWRGDIPWLLTVILITFLGISELFSALRHNGRRPLVVLGAALAIGLPCVAFLDKTLALIVPAIALSVALSLALVMLRRDLSGALDDWTSSLSAALYVGLLMAYFVALRQHDQGLRWILLAFLCTWACDSAAYLVGKTVGRHPFSPRISPKKTWEGTLGGVVAATLAGLLAVPLLNLPAAGALVLGGAVASAAIAGDLVESFIKRQLGIKDSGTLIPGHGGVLDRTDSLLFAVPLVYYVAVLFGGF